MKGYDDISKFVDTDILELKDSLKHLQVQKSRRNSGHSANGSPKSPRSPKSEKKCGRPANPIPRHKRDSHIKAEHRRRDKIQKGFETLRTLVPELEDAPAKESKAVMLIKTAEHCRKIKGECKTLSEQEAALRREIAALGNQIHELTAQLPEAGLDEVEKPVANIDTMYENYVKTNMQKNWKFWLFDFLIRPLFDSFKTMVSTNTPDEFEHSVSEWVKEKMSLPSLRRSFVVAMMNMSNSTCILDNPNELEKQAKEQLTNPRETNNHIQMSEVEKVDAGSSVDPVSPVAIPKVDREMPIQGADPTWQNQRVQKTEESWPIHDEVIPDSIPVFTQSEMQLLTDPAITFSPISSSVDPVPTTHTDVEMSVSDSFLQALTSTDFGVSFDSSQDIIFTNADPILSHSSFPVSNGGTLFTAVAGQGFPQGQQINGGAQTSLATEVKQQQQNFFEHFNVSL